MVVPYTAETLLILTFSDRALRRFFETGDARQLSVRSVERVRRILTLLDVAEHPEEMNMPGLFLHKLHGKPERWSVRVTGNCGNSAITLGGGRNRMPCSAASTGCWRRAWRACAR